LQNSAKDEGVSLPVPEGCSNNVQLLSVDIAVIDSLLPNRIVEASLFSSLRDCLRGRRVLARVASGENFVSVKVAGRPINVRAVRVKFVERATPRPEVVQPPVVPAPPPAPAPPVVESPPAPPAAPPAGEVEEVALVVTLFETVFLRTNLQK
ncbi:hypothetical protein HDU67_005771, partial [Dinochytrium kinnereticum]